MPITATDIKLLESERMADTTDGGGRRTNRIIPDGVAGNIFPKVSRLDAVYGRINLRKVYGAVQTADVDTYAGANVAITDAPNNDRIHVALFSTQNEFDTRSAARDRIESYVTAGPEGRATLLGRQLTGQQTIQVYQRPEAPLPEIGEVYVLANQAGTLTEFDDTITATVLQNILTAAGRYCGICDWRPSSPKSPGPSTSRRPARQRRIWQRQRMRLKPPARKGPRRSGSGSRNTARSAWVTGRISRRMAMFIRSA
jgi:hypothetical protein